MTLTVKTMELHGKVQKWTESIMSDKLETVATESKALEDWDQDPKLNKLIFRALLCLSHAAERANPSETQTGKYLFDIADNLCYSLTEVPDLMKYYSSLYYIARKLIAMKLYQDAMKITIWSFPSNLVQCSAPQHLDMYPKIAYLWHEPALNMIADFPENFTKTGHKLLVELVGNELMVLQVIAKERSAYVLCRIFRYLTKLHPVINHFKLKGNQSLLNIVRIFLDKVVLVLKGEEKYEVYHQALRFVNLTTIAAAGPESIENAPAVFSESCEIWETIFRRDLELNGCFTVYKNIGAMLFKPFDNSGKIRHWDLEQIRKETLDTIGNSRGSKAASWNMRMAGYMLQSLFDHWEHCISTGDEGLLGVAVMRNILGLLKLMFVVLNSVQTNGCEICSENGCGMEKHTHTVTIVSTRSLAIMSKISAGDLLKDMFPLVRELLEDNVAAIFEMKQAGCAQWTGLWNSCGINIYNLSVSVHKALYDETAFLFSLLCACIVRFEGINAVNSIISIKNPLSHVLHKLSSVHFNHGNYREALTPCALNGLLSYQNPDSKAFRMWASIKHACASSQAILKMTMLSCLRADMDVISEIGVDVRLCDYDLSQLCVQELKGLHEGRCNLSLAMQWALDELQILNSGGLEYAQGVHLLGHHLLNYQYDRNFPRYLKRAARKLKEDKFPGDLHTFATASIDFHTFVIDLQKIADQTRAEMETAKFALRASKSSSLEGRPKNNDPVVPAYTKINVGEDSKLFASLQQALNKWSVCIEKNMLHIIEEWYLALTLRTLVLVGEYSRLHRYTTLEIKAWKLAYKVAQHLKDWRICVHVIGRSTSLRNVNMQWINTGHELSTKLKSTAEPEAENAIAFFCLSLTNLYFDIGKHEEAAEMLQRAFSIPSICPHKNLQGFLSSAETALRSYPLCSEDNRSAKSMVYLVRCLYALLALMEYSPQPRVGAKEKQLYSLDLLLACTSNLALRMNSVLSFKEISSHVINRLKLSQASGLTLRAAECLKNLCFIDLSRMQLDDCVVKIQGLEYILQTEYIEASKNAKNPETSTNEVDKPGARDTLVNDTSPRLRKTVFKLPDFLTHGNCHCYKCSSVDYQYLVIAGTHIRAQLYFLQGHLNEAMEHFSGAFFLRRKMMEIEAGKEMNGEKNGCKLHLWKDYHRTVEYVLLLLDFSRFIRELGFDDAINVAIDAVDICERSHLTGHPVYIAAKELVLEYQFCEMFKEADFNKFTVPDASTIDISRFLDTTSSLDSSAIATPASKPLGKKPKTIRRNKTPPLLKLTKVSMILSEDEDEEGSESPKSSRHRTKVGKNYKRQKSLTRKKLQEYLEASPNPRSTNNGAAGVSGLKGPAEVSPFETEEAEEGRETISQIITKAAALFPNLSKQLTKVLDNEGMSDAQIIQRVIELVEQQGTETEFPDNGRRGKCKKSSKSSAGAKSRLAKRDQENAVDELVTSFKKILISNRAGRLSQNADQASSMLAATDNEGEFGSDTEESDTSSIDKRSKRRLEFSESPERIPATDIKAVRTDVPKPEYSRQKERLRTSDRIKRSQSESCSETEQRKSDLPGSERRQSLEGREKPKSLAKQRIKSLKDVPASGNGAVEKRTLDGKQKARNSRRIGRSQSDMGSATSSSFEVIESSQLDDSDIVESSVLEKRRKNGAIHNYKPRTSSRILRSRSQIIVATSDSVSTSDPEESAETKKSISRASSRAKRPDKRPDSQPVMTANSSDDRDEEKLTVSKESETAVTRQPSKRRARGRPKLKR